MNDALSARQTQILKLIIDEYIETALPVGSENLEKKFNIGVSPATIRNEMAQLTKMNFLKQPHTSAGRVPTPRAMKFYIDQLMEEKKMSLTEEVKAKEDVWDVRNDIDALFREATHALAQKTRTLAVGSIDDEERLWHSGYANIFSNPEFADALLCENLFSMLEQVERINQMFFQDNISSPIDVLFGEEMGWQHLEPVSVVVTRFNVGNKNAALGIIGPSRISYPEVIPVLRYYGNLLESIAGSK